MKFKKITRFITKSLKQFIIRLIFKEDVSMLDLKDLIKIAECIDEKYPILPKFLLMPRPGETIDFGPLRFENQVEEDDKIKTNTLQIGRNFIIFNFESYKTWEEEIIDILDVIRKINDNFKLPPISEIRMHYVDEFQINKENFNFESFYEIPINFKNNWKMSYEDFIIGIVPFEEKKKKQKIVMRLKGLGVINKKYGFSLESIFIMRNLSIEISDLEAHLEETHQKIEHYFIEILTDEYKKELGLEYTEIDIG